MGVSGLLPLLKSIHKPCSLKTFSGKTVAVDAYGWLHRGTIACAIELAQNKPTLKWLNFVMHRVRMLVHFGIKPYIVFDGDYLPSKSGTEKNRAAKRRESRKNGLELLRLGKTSQAHIELQKSIDVTPEMARQLIEELKKEKIDYIVAPYEADSQMVYLEKRGIVQAILSEDSDLLVFGAQCLLTKLDQYGDCIMINRNDFTACRDISLVGWSDAEFRTMSILSGCDYLSSIDKMGLKTAYRLIRQHKTIDRIIRAIQFDGKMKVPPGYLDAFHRAEATFLYQWVYCPEACSLVNFSRPSAEVNLDDFPCIGEFVDAETATGVARGDLHPHTKQPIVLATEQRAFNRAPLRTSASFSTPDLKTHKSIESFFRRTPLAELDPNSFTPSPSQRQLLQRGPASWSAESIARPPLTARDSPSIPSTAPERARRSVTDVLPTPIQSPKRQRLCSDGYYATPMSMSSRTESGSSKFFASKVTPSLSRGTSKDRRSASEFNLWSDDSVEEAMAQLDQEPSSPRVKSTKKLLVFRDETVEGESSNESSVVCSGTSAATQSTLPTEESSQGTPITPAEETIFSSGLAANLDLLRRFKCPAPTGRRGEKVRGTTNRRSVSEGDTRRSSSISEGRPAGIAVPCSPVAARSTDSQCTDKSETKILPPCDDFSEADWRAAESQPLNKPSKHESVGVHEAKADVSTVKGSEDLLVPDSEGEEEEEVTAHTGFSFDLERFKFAG